MFGKTALSKSVRFFTVSITSFVLSWLFGTCGMSSLRINYIGGWLLFIAGVKRVPGGFW